MPHHALHKSSGPSPKRGRALKILLLVALSAALIAGYALSDVLQLAYMRRDIGPKMFNIAQYQDIRGYTDLSAKQPAVPKLTPQNTYCVLIFGQSNVANSSNSPFQPRSDALYTAYKGALYKATAPLPGSDGSGSNPALEALDLFAANHPDKNIVLLPIAISGSSVFHWARTGELHDKLVEAVDQAKKLGLPITHVLYHQGEADCAIGTPPGYYKRALRTVLADVRDLGVTAPIILGVASLHKRFDCPDVKKPDCYTTCPEQTAAQRELARETPGVFLGVDSDQLVPWNLRYDGYHFNAEGQTRFARELARILEEHTPKGS